MLIQDGLSYFNGTTLHDVMSHDEGKITITTGIDSHGDKPRKGKMD